MAFTEKIICDILKELAIYSNTLYILVRYQKLKTVRYGSKMHKLKIR